MTRTCSGLRCSQWTASGAETHLRYPPNHVIFSHVAYQINRARESLFFAIRLKLAFDYVPARRLMAPPDRCSIHAHLAMDYPGYTTCE